MPEAVIVDVIRTRSGASGTRLLTTLVHHLEATRMANATVIERL
jgi:hypothetical protein